jgi:hypothetical protein
MFGAPKYTINNLDLLDENYPMVVSKLLFEQLA